MEANVIWLHPRAPSKPLEGAPCNGCGVCCTAAPCPLGVLWSWKLEGRCKALQWDDGRSRYVCGLLASPETMAMAHSPISVWVVTQVVSRWISSGSGCDCSLDASA